MNSVSTILTVILVVVCTLRGIRGANECEFNDKPESTTVTLNSTAEFHCETPIDAGSNPFFLVNGQSVAQEGLDGVTLCNSTQARTIKITIQATSNYNNSNISCLYQSGPSVCCSDPVAILTIIDSGAILMTIATIAPIPSSTQGTTDNFPSPTSMPQDPGNGGGCDKSCVGGIIGGSVVLLAAIISIPTIYFIHKYYCKTYCVTRTPLQNPSTVSSAELTSALSLQTTN